MPSHSDQNSKEELPFLLQLVEIRPAAAFLLIWMAVILAVIVVQFSPILWGIGLATFLLMLVCLGWHVLVCFRLKHEFNQLVRVNESVLLVCLAYLLMIGLFAPVMGLVVESHPSRLANILVGLALGFGLLCHLFIVWSATKSLIAAERDPSASVMQFIGTFLLFYYLPIGIVFVQRRFRKVLAV